MLVNLLDEMQVLDSIGEEVETLSQISMYCRWRLL